MVVACSSFFSNCRREFLPSSTSLTFLGRKITVFVRKNHTTPDEVDLSYCLVTHRESVQSDAKLLEKSYDAKRAGITCFQVRDTQENKAKCWKTVVALKEMVEGTGISIIVNDFPDIAAPLGVGLHIGPNDISPEDARRLMGENAIIGYTLTCYEDSDKSFEELDKARKWIREGVINYIGFQVYASENTHPHGRPWGLKKLELIRSIFKGRIQVIGGINRNTLKDVSPYLQFGPGRDGIAMVGKALRGDTYKEVRLMSNKIKKITLQREGCHQS